MRELGIRRTGCLTNSSRVEAIMKHLQYTAEQIQNVLKSLTVRKKADKEECLEEELLQKRHCEAELLCKVLEEKEVEQWTKKVPSEKAPVSKAPSSAAASSASGSAHHGAGDRAPWPKHEAARSGDSDPSLPEGCRLRQYTPVSASPYWRAELPAGETHLGKMTKCKSYVHSAGVGAAKVNSESARSACVAWLWEWHESKTTPEPATKKRQRS